MKINSNFKDYYDAIQQFYTANDLVYHRIRREICLPNVHHEKRFCYRIYGLLNKEAQNQECASSDFAVNFFSIFGEKRVAFIKYGGGFGKKKYIEKIIWLETAVNLPIFSELEDAPIWRVEIPGFYWRGDNDITVVYNERLADFGVAKLWNVYQMSDLCFRYFCNLGSPRKSIPTISDEMKAITHGFNEFSFRKDKANAQNKKAVS